MSKLQNLKTGDRIYLKATPSIRTYYHGKEAVFIGLCTWPKTNKSAQVEIDGEKIIVARSSISIDPI